jgi:hypothetical protein
MPARGDVVTPRNFFVIFVFFGLLAITFLAAIDFDIWVDDHWGSALTISWSMALLSASHPFATHLFCLLFGGVVGALLTHFFGFRQPDPHPYLEPRMAADFAPDFAPEPESEPAPIDLDALAARCANHPEVQAEFVRCRAAAPAGAAPHHVRGFAPALLPLARLILAQALPPLMAQLRARIPAAVHDAIAFADAQTGEDLTAAEGPLADALGRILDATLAIVT